MRECQTHLGPWHGLAIQRSHCEKKVPRRCTNSPRRDRLAEGDRWT